MRNNNHPIRPAIRINDSRLITTVGGAVALLREHEARPGVDDRDEVLHALERAESEAQLEQAVSRFRAWLEVWGTSIPTPAAPSS